MTRDAEPLLEANAITSDSLKPFMPDPEIPTALEGLYAFQIEATQTEGPEQLQKVCRDFTLERVVPKVYTNFSVEEHPPKNWKDDKNTVWVVVEHGWLSPGKEEIIAGNDGKSLAQRIVASVQTRLGADTKVVIVGIPTIGFNGAEFTDKENFQENLVSGEQYADYLEAMSSALDIPLQKKVDVAHSMAGRAKLLKQGEATIVVNNPAVEQMAEEKASLWSQIRTAGAIGKTLVGAKLNVTQRDLFQTLATSLQVGGKVRNIPGTELAKQTIISKLVDIFLGIGESPTPAQLALKKMYVEQLLENETSAMVMARYLGTQEVDPEKVQPANFIVAEDDSLVSTTTATKFINVTLDSLYTRIQTSPYPWLSSIPRQFLRDNLLRLTRGGHCDVFFDPEVGQIVADEVARRLAIQRLKNDPERMTEIEGFLIEQERWLSEKFSEIEGADRYSHIMSLLGLQMLELTIAKFPENLDEVTNLPNEAIARIWQSLMIREYDVDEETGELVYLNENKLLKRIRQILFGEEQSRKLTTHGGVTMKSSRFGLSLSPEDITELNNAINGVHSSIEEDGVEFYEVTDLSTYLKTLISNGTGAINKARLRRGLSEDNRRNYNIMRDVLIIAQPFSKMVENIKLHGIISDIKYADQILAVLEHLMSKDRDEKDL